MAELESLDIKFVATSDDIPAELGANTLIFLREGEGGGGTQITVGTLTVSVADWSGGTTATKTITGLTADDDIVLFPADADLENEFGVSYTQDGADLDFTATSTPDEDIVYTKYHIYKGVNA